MKKSTIKKVLQELANAPTTAIYKAIADAETADERAEIERLGRALGLLKEKK